MKPLHHDTISMIEKVSEYLEDLYSFRIPVKEVELRDKLWQAYNLVLEAEMYIEDNTEES
jgi:hypothetical protein